MGQDTEVKDVDTYYAELENILCCVCVCVFSGDGPYPPNHYLLSLELFIQTQEDNHVELSQNLFPILFITTLYTKGNRDKDA